MWGLLTDPDNRLQEDGLLLAVQQRRRSSSLVAAAPARPIAMSCGVGVTLRSGRRLRQRLRRRGGVGVRAGIATGLPADCPRVRFLISNGVIFFLRQEAAFCSVELPITNGVRLLTFR
jgi:hypothetical protein